MKVSQATQRNRAAQTEKGNLAEKPKKTNLNDHTRYFRQNMTILHCSVAKSV